MGPCGDFEVVRKIAEVLAEASSGGGGDCLIL